MMKLYPSWFLFFSIILVGTTLIVCGENWFTLWLGFELSLMCFLPMFMGGSLIMEGLSKYFLVQVGGSSLFALSSLLSYLSASGFIFTMSMFMKLGVFPFHMWVPLVMSSVGWEGCLFISVVQKLAPLFVLCNYSHVGPLMLLSFGVLNVLVGGILGMNQSYMRSLMAYSSISHTGWLMLAFLFSLPLFVSYMFVYFSLVTILFTCFSKLKLNKIVSGDKGTKLMVPVMIMFLTISGMPPFPVFYLKVAVILYMTSYFYYIPFLLVGSMASIYFYLTVVVATIPNFLSFASSSFTAPFLTFMLSLSPIFMFVA